MKHKLPLKFWWLFFCEFAFRFMAPFVIPFMLLFRQKAAVEEYAISLPYQQGISIQRYKFPKVLDCMELQDDWNFPSYELTMLNLYNKFGWWVTTYVNLAFRNVGMGVLWQLATPVSNYWVHLSDEEKEEKGLFDNHYRLGNIVLKVGYVTYRNWKGKHGGSKFLAVPRVTLRYEKEVSQ